MTPVTSMPSMIAPLSLRAVKNNVTTMPLELLAENDHSNMTDTCTKFTASCVDVMPQAPPRSLTFFLVFCYNNIQNL